MRLPWEETKILNRLQRAIKNLRSKNEIYHDSSAPFKYLRSPLIQIESLK